jgi:hypothetical protein
MEVAVEAFALIVRKFQVGGDPDSGIALKLGTKLARPGLGDRLFHLSHRTSHQLDLLGWTASVRRAPNDSGSFETPKSSESLLNELIEIRS